MHPTAISMDISQLKLPYIYRVCMVVVNSSYRSSSFRGTSPV